MCDKSLKAYKVDDDDGHSCIVFETNSASARRNGASELDSDWESVESCRRAPQFDRYAPGPVPEEVLIAAGWWFECRGCSKTVTDDSTCTADGTVIDHGTYVVRNRHVFCTQECLARHDASERMKVAAEDALIELVEAKFPGCKIESVHVYGDRLEASDSRYGARCLAYFTFPGAQSLSEYRFGDGAWITKTDLPAFEALYGAA